MHRVDRNSAPKGIKTKDNKWKLKLSTNPQAKHGWDKFGGTLKAKVRESLGKMYGNCCCYCEGEMNATSYPEIEHFRPKGKIEHQHLCYDYTNLHYCCRRCNSAKDEDFDEDMIDPSIEDPTKHIVYNSYIAIAVEGSARGVLMISTLKLNARKDLEKARMDMFSTYERQYKVIEECIEKLKYTGLTNQEVKFIYIVIDEIKFGSEHGSSYCSMLKQNFLDNILLIEGILKARGYKQ